MFIKIKQYFMGRPSENIILNTHHIVSINLKESSIFSDDSPAKKGTVMTICLSNQISINIADEQDQQRILSIIKM
jgi:hypothetical protein